MFALELSCFAREEYYSLVNKNNVIYIAQLLEILEIVTRWNLLPILLPKMLVNCLSCTKKLHRITRHDDYLFSRYCPMIPFFIAIIIIS